ncbi:MAG: glycosyltransferase family 39 protein [Actinobacteria bacterium]|nr:glycosyltransferase family 39 protein [Actinomycetota bacterium]
MVNRVEIGTRADSGGAVQTSGSTWATIVTIGVIATVAAVVPLAVADRFGALGIPRSDDWSYLVTLFRLTDSGELSFNHWVSMSLVGQLVLAAPVAVVSGSSIAAVQIETALLGFAGLVLVALAGARTLGARWPGVLLAVTIAVGPLWGPLAVSYMTDVPAFAMSSLAMFLAVVGLSKRPVSLGWLTASMTVGAAAFTIRQYAIVALLAAFLTGLWWFTTTADQARARRILAIGAALLVASAAFFLWWRTVPDVRSLTPGLPDGHAARVAVVKGAGFLRLVGLSLLPVIAFARPIELMRRSWRASHTFVWLTVVATGSWLALSAWRVPKDIFVGNYLVRDGVLSDIVVIGRRPDVLGKPLWNAMVVVSSLAAIVLAVAAVRPIVGAIDRVRARDWRLRDPVGVYLALTTVGYATSFVLAMATGIQVYDRYVLPLLPAVGLLVLRAAAHAAVPRFARTTSRSWSPRLVLCSCSLLALAFVGFAFDVDSASFDGARWRAARAAVDQGWKPLEVNGGFEWLNYHRRGRPPEGSRQPGREAERAPTICVTVHVNPPGRPDDVVAVVESSAPTRSTARLVAFRTSHPCRDP